MVRTWTDITGKFSVEAVFVSRAMNTVTIRRTDNAKEIKMPLDKLSDGDEKFINSLR
ncbi:MAG: SHD1 domain-containing protein [Pirellulaceae bacterium]